MTGKFGFDAALKTTTMVAGTLGTAAMLAAMPAPAFGQVTGSEQIPGSPDAAENGSPNDATSVKFIDISAKTINFFIKNIFVLFLFC